MTDINNLDAERSAIGALISDKRVQEQASRLTVADFTVPAYRAAFAEIQRLRLDKTPIDLMTVTDRLDGATSGELVDAIQQTPVTFNCSAYVDLVLNASMRRDAAAIAVKLYKSVADQTQDAQEALATARAGLADIGTVNTAGWMSAAEVGALTLADLERRVKGDIKSILSGISDLDYLTGGFFPGELTIVGARPGVGKSVFGMMVAMNAASSGRSSGVCSLEMLDIQYGQRVISSLSGVDGMKLRKAEVSTDDWKLIIAAVHELSKVKTAFMFATRYAEDLALAVRNKKDRDGMDILVVDYLQLLKTRQKTESERMSVATVSWALKRLATECRIPVIAMAQLRRPGQGEGNKMPTMRDLRESGNLEADADNIILLHEPDQKEDSYVHPEDKPYFDGIKARGDRYIAMKVEKQRQGMVGVVSVLFQPNRMNFMQISRRDK